VDEGRAEIDAAGAHLHRVDAPTEACACLEHDRRHTTLLQKASRGQSRRTSADDDHPCIPTSSRNAPVLVGEAA
jgi:hypothetical protein